MNFNLYTQTEQATFLVEHSAFEGVSVIADRVREDLRLVTDCMPARADAPKDCKGSAILAATLGKSALLDRLAADGKLDENELKGKRECYLWQVIKQPFADEPQLQTLLVIAGSDKRGTIYGLFRLSELCGVSPLIYFGDAQPMKQKELVLALDAKYVSKEPSVKYRGFFINDEWPAFGNWCMEHFCDVNAKAYEKIFELLLRLKGNYMWPAMWNSIFSEEGPGLESAILADRYGVIMGASHHEPMCRAGAEWQRIYRDYGDDSTWSFLSNEQAITKFWEDGILRNKDFENVITIGMRGENDSKLLPENATLGDNIEVIKHAIRVQHELMKKNLNPDLSKVPRMLAIYKEVEDYYYGSEEYPGLRDWDELDDVIFLLCEDNHGNTRGLPELTAKKHPGGYGMYYHFDYHGAPISYEWQNSSRLTRTWEQLSQAYDYGVRDMWIVNVGDLKGAEYPLSYFMALAYDFEAWGSHAPNRTELFVNQWLDQQFGPRITAEQKNDLLELLDGYTKRSAARRPETMTPAVYHPTHFDEGERILSETKALIRKADTLKESLPKDCLSAYLSMIYYPAVATLNVALMNVAAARNNLLAQRGSLRANELAQDVAQSIAMDRQYTREFHALFGGKWNHMMDSAHTGFRTWDDYNWTYPVTRTVYPIPGGKAICGFRNSDEYHLGFHWQDQGPLCNTDFTHPAVTEVLIDLDSRGEMDFSFEVTADVPWLSFSPAKGELHPLTQGGTTITVSCDRGQLSEESSGIVTVSVTFANGRKSGSRLKLVAAPIPAAGDSPRFIETQDIIVMQADHYQEKADTDGEGWQIIEHLGRDGNAIKAFPSTKSWIDEANAPWTAYDFCAQSEGEYTAEFWLMPNNPVQKGGPMRYRVAVNDEAPQLVYAVSDDFYTEWYNKEWNDGVTNHIRKNFCTLQVKKGLNRLRVFAGDPGVVVERIILYRKDFKLPDSYLGPRESYLG